MVSAMKGNTKVVIKLLGYDANPNLVDMHGSSALYEAARNGHDETMAVLLESGAELCMRDSLAASVLDQAVFDGDILLLRRLLEAKIQVNALDYDKRGAVHIAAAEGNFAALKLMVEFGADLKVKDRWGNSAEDEAKRARAGKLVDYLRSLDESQER
jgi:ankyrin repeat protein